ncbi:MAG TPA: alpha/beta hydrolase, partial [Symbiobacteriaceae bacterium]|nr:alpha/beta hydrolase [Symbiobacteriaceae bacterium]
MISAGAADGPVVVIETGRGHPAVLWRPVIDLVAKFARVCVYDRPGYGWSDSVGRARSPEEIAGDLHALLEKAGLPGPYILVGHSLGGYYVRLFAARYPAEVAGMVLVDARHESLGERVPMLSGAGDRRFYQIFRVVLQLGLLRLVTRVKPDLLLGGAGFMSRYAPALRQVVRAVMLWPGIFPASALETAGWPAVEAELRQAGPLGELPLVVLSRGRPDLDGWGYSEDLKARVWQAWQACQAELVRLSPRGRQVVVDGAGHMIPLERPEAVAEAIRAVSGSPRPAHRAPGPGTARHPA